MKGLKITLWSSFFAKKNKTNENNEEYKRKYMKP